MNFKTKTSSLANRPKWNPYTTNAKSLTKTCYEPITKITANMKAQRMESRRYQRTNLIDNQRFLHDNDHGEKQDQKRNSHFQSSLQQNRH